MFKEFWLTLTPWRKFKLIMILLLVIYIVIFAIMNWKIQELDFVFFPLKLPMTLLISICLISGYLSSTLFDYRKYKQKEKEINILKEQIAKLEAKSISE
ncbi:MAG: hypothetical protein ACK5B9_13800 [Flavobacteriia bacterium]|jgi:uncharacterized integral membrane protein